MYVIPSCPNFSDIILLNCRALRIPNTSPIAGPSKLRTVTSSILPSGSKTASYSLPYRWDQNPACFTTPQKQILRPTAEDAPGSIRGSPMDIDTPSPKKVLKSNLGYSSNIHQAVGSSQTNTSIPNPVFVRLTPKISKGDVADMDSATSQDGSYDGGESQERSRTVNEMNASMAIQNGINELKDALVSLGCERRYIANLLCAVYSRDRLSEVTYLKLSLK
ncbi:hypothetical protein H072_9438 [Dactylellina haptotyla CBS 200.50]|uniref:Uncharacterized protein n=1 Tax=Dactylellina haptotyla (strain CBS 200.50) TaxID=1284197 RepID=S8A1Y7_DACHA|nr:hypothetical protein H072_9438 [Dactylellina haptotyla CBS 200.50]